MQKPKLSEYPAPPPGSRQVYRNGLPEVWPVYPVMRGKKPLPEPEVQIHPATGVVIADNRTRYPLNRMEVGDYFVIPRTADKNPSYECLRVHLHTVNRRRGKQFVIITPKFPTLVVKRVA